MQALQFATHHVGVRGYLGRRFDGGTELRQRGIRLLLHGVPNLCGERVQSPFLAPCMNEGSRSAGGLPRAPPILDRAQTDPKHFRDRRLGQLARTDCRHDAFPQIGRIDFHGPQRSINLP